MHRSAPVTDCESLENNRTLRRGARAHTRERINARGEDKQLGGEQNASAANQLQTNRAKREIYRPRTALRIRVN